MRTIKKKPKLKGGGINNRWTRNKKFYESKKITSCVGIKSIDQVEKRLTKNFKNKYSLNKEIADIPFYLFPYCSEKNKLEKYKTVQGIDKVNSSQIEYNLLSSLSKVFNYNFQYDETNLISNKNNIIEPIEELKIKERVIKFSEYLNTYDFHNKNGAFIVSHSKFMSAFIKHVEKKLINNTQDNTDYSFDNYDILELVYYKKNQRGMEFYNKLYSIKIRRYDDNYKETIIKQKPENKSKTKALENIKKFKSNGISALESLSEGELTIMLKEAKEAKDSLLNDDEYNELSTYLEDFHENKKHLFLMRHCLGCHNIEPGVKNKMNRVAQGEEGFLKYAMCLEDAFCMLSKKRDFIINFLHDSLSDDKKQQLPKDKPEYISNLLNEYQFGSSIIYRAILTSILLVFSLSKNLEGTNLETCNNLANKILTLDGRFEALEL